MPSPSCAVFSGFLTDKVLGCTFTSDHVLTWSQRPLATPSCEVVNVDGHDVMAWNHGQSQDTGLHHGVAVLLRFEKLRAGSQDDVLVPVRAQKSAYEGPAIAHLYLHALVQPALQQVMACTPLLQVQRE